MPKRHIQKSVETFKCHHFSNTQCRTVARKFSIGGLGVSAGGLYACAGGLDTLKIDKISTDL